MDSEHTCTEIEKATGYEEFHTEIYYDSYDETARYFDLIHSTYQSMMEYVDEHLLLILNRNKFDDFFSFYMDHMNKDLVDNIQLSKQVKKLHH